LEAHDMVARLFADAGVDVGRLDLPDTAPVVVGHIPAPPGPPTVLLYSHYDVVPAGDEAEWDSPPFEPTERDGALFGRGTADTKSNVIAHVGALRAWDGRPPVGIKICIEGYEEIGSGALTSYPSTNPDLFRADAFVIADMGSISPGTPTLTTALRGMGNVTLEVHTLESGKHSGQYGGAAPDALLALLRAIASLHDEHGDVAVAGLRRNEWDGPEQSEKQFRDLGEVLEGMPLIGTGGLGSRIWSGPAITAIGIDVPSVNGAQHRPLGRRRGGLR
jgi:acetylornithine deacetylase/succinyl-diaminopimelate desuccinylase-like protein